MKRQGLWGVTVSASIGIAGLFCLGNCGQPAALSVDSNAAALAVTADATPGEIKDSGSPFNDVDTVAWAQAGRAAAYVCGQRGFAGGFFTGTQDSETKGLVCVGGGAQSFDATPGQLLDSGWVFDDADRVGWAQAARAAARICGKQGFIGGFFSGSQTTGKKGLICVKEGAKWFSASPGEILDSGWPFDDNNTIGWAYGARAAAVLCSQHGFLGGFFNGSQGQGRHGMICVR